MSLTQSRSMGAGTTRAAAASSLPTLLALAWSGGSTNLYSSSNGTSWTKTTRSTPTVFADTSIGGSGPQDVASNGSSILVTMAGLAAYTTDMTTWTGSSPTGAVQCYWTGSTWVASGNNASLNNFTISTSTNGTTWTSRYTGTSSETSYRGLFANSVNVLAALDGCYYTTTANATAGWTKKTILTNAYFTGMAFGASLWVAVGQNSGGQAVIYTATDPSSTWTSRTVTGGTSPFQDVVFGNSKFVAVGNTGRVSTSTDGVTWTAQTAITNDLYSVVYSTTASLFIATSSNGVIYSSPDGVTWTSRYTDSSQFIVGVVAVA